MVSVIIPVYNVEEYVRECAESIVNQTYKDIEIIMVDDGSTDGSGKICEELKSRYDNITVIHQNNMGQGAARNVGLKIAKGKYVYFVDSDDYIKPETLESLILKSETEKLDMLFFDSDIIIDMQDFHDIANYDRSNSIKDKIMSGIDYLTSYGKKNFIVSPCMVLYNKKFLNENRLEFVEGHIYEDNIFTFQAITKAERVNYINRKFYVRRYRNNSTMTNVITKKNVEDSIFAVDYILKYIVWEMREFKGGERRCIRDFVMSLIRQSVKCIERCENINENEYIGKIENCFWLGYEKLYQDEDKKNITYFNQLFYMEFLLEKNKGREDVTELLQLLVSMNLAEELRKMYKILFETLPLNQKGSLVGIYGLGGHTKNFLDYYQNIYGEIKSKYFFIDSKCKSFSSKFMNHDIINVNDVQNRVDAVIISSYTYEDIMQKNIDMNFNENVPVYKFYGNEGELLFNIPIERVMK